MSLSRSTAVLLLATLCATAKVENGRMRDASFLQGSSDAAAGHHELECGMRSAAFKFSPVLPKDAKDLFDALELRSRCDLSFDDVMLLRKDDPGQNSSENKKSHVSQMRPRSPDNDDCHNLFVGKENGLNTFTSIHDALTQSRSLPPSLCKRINLPPGPIFLDKKVRLGHRDSHLIIEGAEDGSTWISGGVAIDASNAPKRKISTDMLLYEIPLPETGISKVPGLFLLEPHIRFQSARWPNTEAEGTIQSEASDNNIFDVREWIRREPGELSNFTYIDLSDPKNPTGKVKDDSTMDSYNTYVSAKGGVCDEIWDTSYSSSYWCSNSSAGGWAEVDSDFANVGAVGLPVGLAYNTTNNIGQRISRWRNATGAIVFARHSQSWFSNMFEVAEHDKSAGELRFGRGGSQGGRNWCQCDQCTYAARSWCKPPDEHGDVNDDRLIGGEWHVENVAEELDAPGEFFFDESSQKILLLLNETDVDAHSDLVVVVPKLSTLIDLDGADHVTLSNIGFRDARNTYLEKHGVPSGGDWSLYRGAAVMLANTLGTTVKNSRFSRLDGTALMLTERTRQVTIESCEFEWLGESAMAAWGYTEEWDGRDGRQPRDTLIQYNIVREIGLFQKQSSAWFQAKSSNTHLKGNLFFNMPRAAINFNDGFGGGNSVSNNLLFNTCRRSGDHGPINSWDRQPFLWDASGEYGFDTPPSTLSENFLVANYGASQGIDNDDGSSFYHIVDNINFGDGFKMDYGGHDSLFQRNLVIVSPYDGQNCYNLMRFKPLHQHTYSNNTCAILSCRQPECDDMVGTTADSCESPTFPLLAHNTYYTKNGNASLTCGGVVYPVDEAKETFKTIELGSRSLPLPNDEQLIHLLFKWVMRLKERQHTGAMVSLRTARRRTSDENGLDGGIDFQYT